MKLDSMKPARGARKGRKRVGRGPGSGHGKTSARGHKGLGARSGGGHAKPGFEGGQMPLARRLPKRGFTNPTRVAYQVVNLKDLARFEAGAVVDASVLRQSGMARRRMPVKVLGGGSLDHAVTVRLQAFSEAAKKGIEVAGGTAEVVAAQAADGAAS